MSPEAHINQEFGKRLTILFEDRGLKSREERAEFIGVHKNSVDNFMKGNVPRWEILVRIAHNFGVSTDWLLTGTGEHGRKARVAEPPPDRDDAAGIPTEPTGALTAARVRAMAINGLPVPQERAEELMRADALALETGAWIRVQTMRNPGALPRVETAIHRMKQEFAGGNTPAREADAAPSPCPEDGAATENTDWVPLPPHDPRRLDEDERERLAKTLVVLRCPPGCEEMPREALEPNIESFYRTTRKHLNDKKADGQSPERGGTQHERQRGGSRRAAGDK